MNQQNIKIFIGADHNGFHLKNQIIEYLIKLGYEVVDEGDKKLNPDDDFPFFASRVVNAMKAEGEHARGILICGSGQGMVIAANRHRGIRAGLGWSVDAAKSIRHDEDSNVLALPSEILVKDDKWKDVVDAWLRTSFAGATRFKRRNLQLDEL